MEVKPYTGLAQLQYRTLVRRFAEFYKAWATEMDWNEDILAEMLESYLMTSVRMEANGAAEGKHFAVLTDDEKKAKKKFLAFLDLPVPTTNAWVQAINAKDAPTDPNKVNEAVILDTDEKNVGSDGTGSATS